jgi:hypothetical protein
MRTLELENYGVMEMNTFQVMSIDGGGKPKSWTPWGIGVFLVEEIISNWDDFKAGFDQAVSGQPCVYKPKK